jgi:hypothetical protein
MKCSVLLPKCVPVPMPVIVRLGACARVKRETPVHNALSASQRLIRKDQESVFILYGEKQCLLNLFGRMGSLSHGLTRLYT